MALAYHAIGADSHVLEPFSRWEEYMDPRFRDRRPRRVIDENGKERPGAEGELLGTPRALAGSGRPAGRRQARRPQTCRREEGGFDPPARIADMRLDGIDAAFLYPGLGLFGAPSEDPGLAAAMCRATSQGFADDCTP